MATRHRHRHSGGAARCRPKREPIWLLAVGRPTWPKIFSGGQDPYGEFSSVICGCMAERFGFFLRTPIARIRHCIHGRGRSGSQRKQGGKETSKLSRYLMQQLNSAKNPIHRTPYTVHRTPYTVQQKNHKAKTMTKIIYFCLFLRPKNIVYYAVQQLFFYLRLCTV